MEFIYIVNNVYDEVLGLFADEETACQNAKSICEEIGDIVSVTKAPLGIFGPANNEEYVACFKVDYGNDEKILRII